MDTLLAKEPLALQVVTERVTYAPSERNLVRCRDPSQDLVQPLRSQKLVEARTVHS